MSRSHRSALKRGAVFGLAAALGALPVHAQWSLRGEAGALYDDNPGNAADREATVPVTAAVVAFEASHATYITDRLSLRLAGRIRGEAYNRAEGLNQTTLALEGALRQKWGLGALAPWTELGLTVAREQAREELRRGWLTRGALRFGKRLGDTFSAGADAWAERRRAPEGVREEADLPGDAFSRLAHGFSLRVDADLSERLSLSVAYLRRGGEVTISSLEAADDYPQAKAAAIDPTFGPGFFAYRVDGTSHGGRAALAYGLSRDSSLVLAFERQVTTIQGGEVYGRNMSTLTFKVTF